MDKVKEIERIIMDNTPKFNSFGELGHKKVAEILKKFIHSYLEHEKSYQDIIEQPSHSENMSFNFTKEVNDIELCSIDYTIGFYNGIRVLVMPYKVSVSYIPEHDYKKEFFSISYKVFHTVFVQPELENK